MSSPARDSFACTSDQRSPCVYDNDGRFHQQTGRPASNSLVFTTEGAQPLSPSLLDSLKKRSTQLKAFLDSLAAGGHSIPSASLPFRMPLPQEGAEGGQANAGFRSCIATAQHPLLPAAFPHWSNYAHGATAACQGTLPASESGCVGQATRATGFLCPPSGRGAALTAAVLAHGYPSATATSANNARGSGPPGIFSGGAADSQAQACGNSNGSGRHGMERPPWVDVRGASRNSSRTRGVEDDRATLQRSSSSGGGAAAAAAAGVRRRSTTDGGTTEGARRPSGSGGGGVAGTARQGPSLPHPLPLPRPGLASHSGRPQVAACVAPPVAAPVRAAACQHPSVAPGATPLPAFPPAGSDAHASYAGSTSTGGGAGDEGAFRRTCSGGGCSTVSAGGSSGAPRPPSPPLPPPLQPAHARRSSSPAPSASPSQASPCQTQMGDIKEEAEADAETGRGREGTCAATEAAAQQMFGDGEGGRGDSRANGGGSSGEPAAAAAATATVTAAFRALSRLGASAGGFVEGRQPAAEGTASEAEAAGAAEPQQPADAEAALAAAVAVARASAEAAFRSPDARVYRARSAFTARRSGSPGPLPPPLPPPPHHHHLPSSRANRVFAGVSAVAAPFAAFSPRATPAGSSRATTDGGAGSAATLAAAPAGGGGGGGAASCGGAGGGFGWGAASEYSYGSLPAALGGGGGLADSLSGFPAACGSGGGAGSLYDHVGLLLPPPACGGGSRSRSHSPRLRATSDWLLSSPRGGGGGSGGGGAGDGEFFRRQELLLRKRQAWAAEGEKQRLEAQGAQGQGQAVAAQSVRGWEEREAGWSGGGSARSGQHYRQRLEALRQGLGLEPPPVGGAAAAGAAANTVAMPERAAGGLPTGAHPQPRYHLLGPAGQQPPQAALAQQPQPLAVAAPSRAADLADHLHLLSQAPLAVQPSRAGGLTDHLQLPSHAQLQSAAAAAAATARAGGLAEHLQRWAVAREERLAAMRREREAEAAAREVAGLTFQPFIGERSRRLAQVARRRSSDNQARPWSFSAGGSGNGAGDCGGGAEGAAVAAVRAAAVGDTLQRPPPAPHSAGGATSALARPATHAGPLVVSAVGATAGVAGLAVSVDAGRAVQSEGGAAAGTAAAAAAVAAAAAPRLHGRLWKQGSGSAASSGYSTLPTGLLRVFSGSSGGTSGGGSGSDGLSRMPSGTALRASAGGGAGGGGGRWRPLPAEAQLAAARNSRSRGRYACESATGAAPQAAGVADAALLRPRAAASPPHRHPSVQPAAAHGKRATSRPQPPPARHPSQSRAVPLAAAMPRPSNPGGRNPRDLSRGRSHSRGRSQSHGGGLRPLKTGDGAPPAVRPLAHTARAPRVAGGVHPYEHDRNDPRVAGGGICNVSAEHTRRADLVAAPGAAIFEAYPWVTALPYQLQADEAGLCASVAGSIGGGGGGGFGAGAGWGVRSSCASFGGASWAGGAADGGPFRSLSYGAAQMPYSRGPSVGSAMGSIDTAASTSMPAAALAAAAAARGAGAGGAGLPQGRLSVRVPQRPWMPAGERAAMYASDGGAGAAGPALYRPLYGPFAPLRSDGGAPVNAPVGVVVGAFRSEAIVPASTPTYAAAQQPSAADPAAPEPIVAGRDVGAEPAALAGMATESGADGAFGSSGLEPSEAMHAPAPVTVAAAAAHMAAPQGPPAAAALPAPSPLRSSADWRAVHAVLVAAAAAAAAAAGEGDDGERNLTPAPVGSARPVSDGDVSTSLPMPPAAAAGTVPRVGGASLTDAVPRAQCKEPGSAAAAATASPVTPAVAHASPTVEAGATTPVAATPPGPHVPAPATAASSPPEAVACEPEPLSPDDSPAVVAVAVLTSPGVLADGGLAGPTANHKDASVTTAAVVSGSPRALAAARAPALTLLTGPWKAEDADGEQEAYKTGDATGRKEAPARVSSGSALGLLSPIEVTAVAATLLPLADDMAGPPELAEQSASASVSAPLVSRGDPDTAPIRVEAVTADVVDIPAKALNPPLAEGRGIGGGGDRHHNTPFATHAVAETLTAPQLLLPPPPAPVAVRAWPQRATFGGSGSRDSPLTATAVTAAATAAEPSSPAGIVFARINSRHFSNASSSSNTPRQASSVAGSAAATPRVTTTAVSPSTTVSRWPSAGGVASGAVGASGGGSAPIGAAAAISGGLFRSVGGAGGGSASSGPSSGGGSRMYGSGGSGSLSLSQTYDMLRRMVEGRSEPPPPPPSPYGSWTSPPAAAEPARESYTSVASAASGGGVGSGRLGLSRLGTPTRGTIPAMASEPQVPVLATDSHGAPLGTVSCGISSVASGSVPGSALLDEGAGSRAGTTACEPAPNSVCTTTTSLSAEADTVAAADPCSCSGGNSAKSAGGGGAAALRGSGFPAAAMAAAAGAAAPRHGGTGELGMPALSAEALAACGLGPAALHQGWDSGCANGVSVGGAAAAGSTVLGAPDGAGGGAFGSAVPSNGGSAAAFSTGSGGGAAADGVDCDAAFLDPDREYGRSSLGSLAGVCLEYGLDEYGMPIEYGGPRESDGGAGVRVSGSAGASLGASSDGSSCGALPRVDGGGVPAAAAAPDAVTVNVADAHGRCATVTEAAEVSLRGPAWGAALAEAEAKAQAAASAVPRPGVDAADSGSVGGGDGVDGGDSDGGGSDVDSGSLAALQALISELQELHSPATLKHTTIATSQELRSPATPTITNATTQELHPPTTTTRRSPPAGSAAATPEAARPAGRHFPNTTITSGRSSSSSTPAAATAVAATATAAPAATPIAAAEPSGPTAPSPATTGVGALPLEELLRRAERFRAAAAASIAGAAPPPSVAPPPPALAAQLRQQQVQHSWSQGPAYAAGWRQPP